MTRNITLEPVKTMRQLLELDRHGIGFDALDFVACISLSEDKLQQFRSIREQFDVNPALDFACGDEQPDYAAAVGAGLPPFIASCGFEDFRRLRDDQVPEEVIAATPHALGLLPPQFSPDQTVGG